MHIGHEKYLRERQRHELALRMIRHEARTCTIRSCTGLTDDRIRKLYKAYAKHVLAMPLRRHRGKSPRQVAFFTRSTRIQFEASLLASVFSAFGLVDLLAPDALSLAYAVRFCDAFETHRQLFAEAGISFEHAWFLLQLLRQGTGLQAARCRHCDSHYLRDEVNVAHRSCPACKLKGYPSAPPLTRRPRASAPYPRATEASLVLATESPA
jgi:hypothetical protein